MSTHPAEVPPALSVRDNPAESRYEAVTLTGVVAAFAAYRRRGDRVVFTHTRVEDAFAGQGVGTTLVRGSLDDVRDRGLVVRPLCPFYARFFDRHPEYADLLG